MRPSWDETWMNVARVVAMRARCSRARVGAVIVDPTNRIVATGYNGPPAGLERLWEYECDGSEQSGFCIRGRHGPTDETRASYTDCSDIHAELNAISFCDRRDREFGTIYCTSTFCLPCAKVVANSGLRRAVVLDDSKKYSHRGWSETRDFLLASGMIVETLHA